MAGFPFLGGLNNTCCIYTTISSSTHVLIRRCSCVLVNINNTTMDMRVQISFSHSVDVIFGYVLKSGIAGSYDSCIFYFLRSIHTTSHND